MIRALAIGAFALVGASLGCAEPGEVALDQQVHEAITTCRQMVVRRLQEIETIEETAAEFSRQGWRASGGEVPRSIPEMDVVLWHPTSDVVAIGMPDGRTCWAWGARASGAVQDVAQALLQDTEHWTRIADPNEGQFSFVSAEPIRGQLHALLFLGAAGNDATAMVSTVTWPE